MTVRLGRSHLAPLAFASTVLAACAAEPASEDAVAVSASDLRGPRFAPRPYAPRSGGIATSQTPRFAWHLGPGVTGARLEICADRACTRIEQTVAVRGSSAPPPSPLTPGVHFWRVRGQIDCRDVGGFSPTWEVSIGHRSAPVDTSWGSLADFDGDGYSDHALTMPPASFPMRAGDGHVHVTRGSASGLAKTATQVLTIPDVYVLGVSSTQLVSGDVNGDGYADLMVSGNLPPPAPPGTPAGVDHPARVWIFFGGPRGLSERPDVVLAPPGSRQGFVMTVASAGDVNGDGYADLFVGSGGMPELGGVVYVYRGGPHGPGASPTQTLEVPAGMKYFAPGVALGDIDGDGYGDLAFPVGAEPAAGPVKIQVFRGGPSGLTVGPSIDLEGSPTGAPRLLASGIDANGDGYADLFASKPGASSSMTGQIDPGRAYLYTGGPGGLATKPAVTIESPDADAFGIATAALGDVDGDGYGDALVTSFALEPNTPSHAYVYRGSAAGISVTPSTVIASPAASAQTFGALVSALGDANGDTFADAYFFGSPATAPDQPGVSYVYYGSVRGLPADPSALVDSPTP